MHYYTDSQMFIGIIFLIVLTLIIEYIIIRITAGDRIKYSRRVCILTKGEKSFYGILKIVTKDMDIIICPQVSINSLLDLPKEKRGWRFWDSFSEMKGWYVDFILCDKKTMNILLPIELDDKTHYLRHRKKRDTIIDKIIYESGLPILHVRASYAYQFNELHDLITKGIQEIQNKNSQNIM